jgi:hypothetical protein
MRRVLDAKSIFWSKYILDEYFLNGNFAGDPVTFATNTGGIHLCFADHM